MSEATWKGWSLGAQISGQQAGQRYIDSCRSAVENSVIFKEFKRISSYTDVVTSPTRIQAEQYLRKIALLSPQLLKNDSLEKLKRGDTVGNPVLFTFPEIDGKISSTILRYTNVLSELVHNFESLDDLRIVEIGAGYGGQCRVISEFFDFKSYTIIDLHESCELAKKYLGVLCDITNVNFMTKEDVKNSSDEYDLIISNYAFSELDKQNQEFYIEKILDNTERGYITYNALRHHNKSHLGRQYPYDDIEMTSFFSAYTNLKCYNENVIRSECSVFVWGQDDRMIK